MGWIKENSAWKTKKQWAIEPKSKKGAKIKKEGGKKKLGYCQPIKTRIKKTKNRKYTNINYFLILPNFYMVHFSTFLFYLFTYEIELKICRKTFYFPKRNMV